MYVCILCVGMRARACAFVRACVEKERERQRERRRENLCGNKSSVFLYGTGCLLQTPCEIGLFSKEAVSIEISKGNLFHQDKSLNS